MPAPQNKFARNPVLLPEAGHKHSEHRKMSFLFEVREKEDQKRLRRR
jgi:hypothetical protein